VKPRRQRYFWPHVAKTGTCWLWTGRIHKGYGYYSGTGAHRVSFELANGPIPAGMELDHLCRVRNCVNPAHLEPVTRAENMRRWFALQTHCNRGHEFTPENTYLYARRRHCRACNVRRQRERKARMASAVTTS